MIPLEPRCAFQPAQATKNWLAKAKVGPDKQKSHGLWIRPLTSFAFTPRASQIRPIDSVAVRRDLDSVPAALREIADEALRGNIDMAEALAFYRGADSRLSAN